MPVISPVAMMEQLRRFGLLTAPQLTEISGQIRGRCHDARALAKLLLQRGWLTAFQVEHLLVGKGQNLLLGPYLLLDHLGRGGLSQVFKARHTEHDLVVALKLIKPELFATPEGRQQFLLEVEAMAQLDHPNIVQFCDADQIGDTYYYAMEFVEGIDLGRFVQRYGPLPVLQACDYVRQVALGLQHAHEHNLIHRDIKPVNLWLETRDESNPVRSAAPRTGNTVPITARVKILDWGLASLRPSIPSSRDGDVSDAAPSGILGTPNYLAPEQADNPNLADIRSDIYSLGCTLYFLLTGQPPFPDGTVEDKIARHRDTEPLPVTQFRDDVPDELGHVSKRMLAKNPTDRFQTPAAVAVAMLPFTRIRPGKKLGATRSDNRTPLPGALNVRGIKTSLQSPRPAAEVTSHPAADTSYPS